MNKLLFGIFAHPDDEAFGPSATLIKEIEGGCEVQLICVTRGEAGTNKGNHSDLGEIRLQEWHKACRLMGVTKNYNLGYPDGMLNNNSYHEIAAKIKDTILAACDEKGDAIELSLMTFDINGLTGHLDHIAVSYITTFVFYQLKTKLPKHVTIRELAYFCRSRQQMPKPNLDFVFMPAGHTAGYITRRVDVREFLDKKYAVMRAHRSQSHDAQQLIAKGDEYQALDNFHVIFS